MNLRRRVFAAAMVVAGGCAGLSGTQSLESLRLTAAPQKRSVRVGDRLTVLYGLTNAGTESIHGCMTFKSGYDLWGPSGIRQNINTTDHAGCIENFKLQSGESIGWSTDLTVPDIGIGPATFDGWIQVAIPNTCDRYGCDQSVVRARRENLEVVASK